MRFELPASVLVFMLSFGLCTRADPNAVYGVWASFVAMPAANNSFWDLLASGTAIVDAEPGTLQWLSLKDDAGPFVYLATFKTEAARAAHLAGRLPAALKAAAHQQLAQAPVFDSVTLLASKVADGNAPQLRFTGSGNVVAANATAAAHIKGVFTGSYYDAVLAQNYTNYWWMFQINATAFGLAAAWPTLEARQEHSDSAAVSAMIAAVEPYAALFEIPQGSAIGQKIEV
ncbi:hypothetical protein K488DRAFT_87903 [Vararia minispora EC-137]|uniref:Uncharacterized protein n=1 Tax=Vararia minispora EC-137 TaxID=1314806 RepID=A0ACB8QFE0_9AGAM|nr:hypothetical protein K488DRAFT_87903 [Vararia minispora EC-137]